MKILIFYAAYGGGHLSAAKSIKQYIDDHYKDAETEMVDCIKYINKDIDKLTTLAYKEMAKNAPWAWGKIYNQSQHGAMAHISNGANKLMSIKLHKLFDEFNPDIVISTHPFGSQMTAYLKRKGKTNCILASVMTDFASHDQWLVGNEQIDYFFVSHEGMKKDISKRVEDAGYKLSKCDIDADLNNSSENAGIHSIGLTLSRKNIEKVEIDFSNKNDEKNTNEEEQIRDDIAKYYEIDKNLINVKIK